MEAYSWNSTSLSFTLRNVGSSSVTVASVYLGGNALATGLSTAIAIGGTDTFSYSPSGCTDGAAHTQKIVSATGWRLLLSD